MKGVLFTAITFLMVFAVVSLASTFADLNIELQRDVSRISSADKVGYAFESIQSQMGEATLVRLFKDRENLTFNDTIPRDTLIEDNLRRYGNFVDKIFEDPTLTIQFIDTAGGVVQWEDVDALTIRPFNITYVYPNTGKNSMEVRFANETELAHLERIELYVKTNGLLVNNASGWSPEKLCAPAGVPPNCLPFRVKIEDSSGLVRWDSGEKNFEMDQQSAIQHAVGAGWIRITVGRTGSDDRILQIETNSITADVSTKITFDTEDFAGVNTPARLRAFDSFTFLEADL